MTRSIILKNGTAYVWYEPFHKVVQGRHYFGGGAYLYNVGNDVRKGIEEEFQKLAA